MLRWDEMHPYNAAHVIRFAVPLDVPRLRETLRRGLAVLGLGRLTLSVDDRTYSYATNPDDVELKILEPGNEGMAALATETERQLNTRFDRRAGFVPVRFFAMATSDGFFLGLVYFHPAADGEAAVHLMRNLAEAYLGKSDPPAALTLYRERHDRWFRQPPGLLVKKFSSLVRLAHNMRKSRRTRAKDLENARCAVSFFSLTPPEFAALVRAGKAWNATINDLFLALLLKCVLRLQGGRTVSTRRPWLSVGCIVNLRKDLALDSPRTFGLFLGSFVVTHRGATEVDLQELVAQVRRETSRIKRDRLYLGAPLELALARRWLGFLSGKQRARFYQTHFPLWGGISNMNLNPLWPPENRDGVCDCFRAVSTGPVTPLVLSLTSFGAVTNIGVSYRPAIYSAADIEVVKQCFIESVRELQGPA